MKRMAMMMLAAVCLAVLFSAGCSRKKSGDGANAPAATIQIKGSDTMVNLGRVWASEFMRADTSVVFSVTGGGSGTGIASLIQGSAQVAQSSRSMKPEEIDQAKKNKVEPNEIKVGFDGIAVVVHPENPVSKLTVAQLADIFAGKITDWSRVGGAKGKIVLLSREVNSGTHVYFKEHVLNGGDAKGTKEFAASALLIPSSQGIANEVTSNPSAIGYYGMGYISSQQKALHIAKESGAEYVEPTIDNVFSGKYPISRPLFLYTNGAPKGGVKAFIDFVLSPPGQAIEKKEGFVPITK